MAKKPLLSIALLCSNRIDTVRRCLDSLIPIMERIPSELILLDTSTDPKVPPVLAEYTDNITKFQWVNDFSAARNVTVQKAKGEWYLYIDDDEWFVEIEDLVHFFNSGEYKKYGCANYIQRNFHDPDLTHYSDSWVSRIIKLTPETHFESKIHEYMVPVPGECKNLNLIANHTGYIAVTEADKEKRFKRNSVLLKEMIAEQPNVLRWRVQMAQEYNAMHMWEEQIAFCLENLEYFKDTNNKWDNRDIGTFYAGLSEAYVFTKQYQKVYEIGEQALQDKRCSELCHAYVYLRIAATAFCMENWNLAKKSVESYLMLLAELDKTPDRKANQEGALLVNEACDAIPMRRAYAILIGAGLKEGSTKPLHQYLPKLDWDKKVIYVFEPLIPVLVEAMVKLPYEPIFAEVMQLMWNNKELQKQVLTEVYEWEQKDTRAKEILFRILDQIEPRHWYIWNAKVIIADMDGDKERVLYALEGLFKSIKNIFLVPGEITQIIKKYKISQEALYLSVPFDTWTTHLREFIEKVSEQDMLIAEWEITAMKSVENIRYDYFFARIAEAKLLYHAGEQEYAKKKAYLLNFSQKSMDFLRKYYQPQVFEEAPELLPEYGQAALLIENGFALEESNPTEMLRVLKEVVGVYPTFTNIIRGFISAYGIEQDEKKRRQREEMRNLKGQILAQVQTLVAQKQYETALGIVKQLKQMQPDDLELVALALELRLATLK